MINITFRNARSDHTISTLSELKPLKKISQNVLLRKTIICGLISYALFSYILLYIFAYFENVTGPYKTQLPFNYFALIERVPNYMLFITIIISMSLTIYTVMKLVYKMSKKDRRNFRISDMGYYGTARWMTWSEISDRFALTETNEPNGLILGYKNDKAICKPWSAPNFDLEMNNNWLLSGQPGTRKSRGFLIPAIFECLKQGLPVIVNDSKGFLYSATYHVAKKLGYNIKIFNCQSGGFSHSDGWDALRLVIDADDPVAAAQMMADVIVENTQKTLSKDPAFWRDMDANLLNALLLYVAFNPSFIPPSGDYNDRTIAGVYCLIEDGKVKNNKGQFMGRYFTALMLEARKPLDGLPQKKDLFRSSFNTWLSNTQAEQCLSNLSMRLTNLQNENITNMLSQDEIKINDISKGKNIIYIIVDDQVDTYKWISSLFITYVFYALTKHADSLPEQRLERDVWALLDEFPAMGTIPDFSQKKIATLRSRGVGLLLAIQGLEQMQFSYPETWESIINCCDIKTLLGTNNNITAKYFSDHSGDCTVEYEEVMIETNKLLKRFSRLDPTKESRRRKTYFGRKLITPDEAIGISKDRVIHFIGNTNTPIECYKYDMSMHTYSKIPPFNEFGEKKKANVTEHIPLWAAKKGDAAPQLNKSILECLNITIQKSSEGIWFYENEELGIVIKELDVGIFVTVPDGEIINAESAMQMLTNKTPNELDLYKEWAAKNKCITTENKNSELPKTSHLQEAFDEQDVGQTDTYVEHPDTVVIESKISELPKTEQHAEKPEEGRYKKSCNSSDNGSEEIVDFIHSVLPSSKQQTKIDSAVIEGKKPELPKEKRFECDESKSINTPKHKKTSAVIEKKDSPGTASSQSDISFFTDYANKATKRKKMIEEKMREIEKKEEVKSNYTFPTIFVDDVEIVGEDDDENNRHI